MTPRSETAEADVSFDDYARTRRAAVDAALDRLLPAPPACPPLIAEAMRYTVFSGGKRLRPLLTLARHRDNGQCDLESDSAGRMRAPLALAPLLESFRGVDL